MGQKGGGILSNKIDSSAGSSYTVSQSQPPNLLPSFLAVSRVALDFKWTRCAVTAIKISMDHREDTKSFVLLCFFFFHVQKKYRKENVFTSWSSLDNKQ
jgi:hypothetical protein